MARSEPRIVIKRTNKNNPHWRDCFAVFVDDRQWEIFGRSVGDDGWDVLYAMETYLTRRSAREAAIRSALERRRERTAREIARMEVVGG